MNLPSGQFFGAPLRQRDIYGLTLTLSHYPAKGDLKPIIPCAPAPPSVASQIYTQAIMPKMVLRMAKGESIDKTLEWTEAEVGGFFRN